MTVKLDNNRVYRGSGVFRIGDKESGVVDELDFVYRHVGFGEDNSKSFYGTINGKVDNVYAARHDQLDVDAKVVEVNEENAEHIHITISNVEFIDPIPQTGILQECEFSVALPTRS